MRGAGRKSRPEFVGVGLDRAPTAGSITLDSLGGQVSRLEKAVKVLECASNYASKNSVAAVLGLQNNSVGNALFGNTVAAIVDIFLSVASDNFPDVFGIIAAGPLQGLPLEKVLPSIPKGAADVVGEFINKVAVAGTAAAETLGMSTAAAAVNATKLAFDAAVFKRFPILR